MRKGDDDTGGWNKRGGFLNYGLNAGGCFSCSITDDADRLMETCATLCAGDDACKSFEIKPTSGECCIEHVDSSDTDYPNYWIDASAIVANCPDDISHEASLWDTYEPLTAAWRDGVDARDTSMCHQFWDYTSDVSELWGYDEHERNGCANACTSWLSAHERCHDAHATGDDVSCCVGGDIRATCRCAMDYEWWDDRRLSAVDEPRRLGHCCDYGAYCSCMESELGAGCTAPDCGGEDGDEDEDEGTCTTTALYYDGSQDLSSHDASKCREHSCTSHDGDCCGYDHETWCADGYTLVRGSEGEHDCWPGKKGYRCLPSLVASGSWLTSDHFNLFSGYGGDDIVAACLAAAAANDECGECVALHEAWGGSGQCDCARVGAGCEVRGGANYDSVYRIVRGSSGSDDDCDPSGYVAVSGRGCESYIHMDDGWYGDRWLSGGSTSLEDCAAAVRAYDGQDGCRGAYFFYEHDGYCNCPTDDCELGYENENAGGSGQLYRSGCGDGACDSIHVHYGEACSSAHGEAHGCPIAERPARDVGLRSLELRRLVRASRRVVRARCLHEQQSLRVRRARGVRTLVRPGHS